MRHAEPPEAYQECLNQSLECLESHLGNDFSLEEMAWHACLSPFHFHRIFHKLVGRTPGEHLRRRRLDSAARALLGSNLPVAEIAHRYGYISLQGFMRAFRDQFYTSPAEYRNLGLAILLDSPLELRLGQASSEPAFSEPVATRSESKRIMGLSRTGENDHPSNMRLLWQALGRLGDRARTQPWISLDRYSPGDDGPYQFFVGLEIQPHETCLPGLEILEMPERTEAHIQFFGSFDDLWKGGFSHLWCHLLPGYGMRPESTLWKHSPQAPSQPNAPVALSIPLAA